MLKISLMSACCSPTPPQLPGLIFLRDEKILFNALKILPQYDGAPPVTISNEYVQPLPVNGVVKTAGGEDSLFIMPDVATLNIWFTPDVNQPPKVQLMDGVTGIYVSQIVADLWQKPHRIKHQDPGKLASDGCEFILGDRVWFSSAMKGYSCMHWFTAEFQNGTWQNWQIADFDPACQVNEFQISSDGKDLYFDSDRPCRKGADDHCVSQYLYGEW